MQIMVTKLIITWETLYVCKLKFRRLTNSKMCCSFFKNGEVNVRKRAKLLFFIKLPTAKLEWLSDVYFMPNHML